MLRRPSDRRMDWDTWTLAHPWLAGFYPAFWLALFVMLVQVPATLWKLALAFLITWMFCAVIFGTLLRLWSAYRRTRPAARRTVDRTRRGRFWAWPRSVVVAVAVLAVAAAAVLIADQAVADSSAKGNALGAVLALAIAKSAIYDLWGRRSASSQRARVTTD